MPDRSLLIVNFRSAGLAKAAVESARSSSSVALQIVIVDNSEDADEARELRSDDVGEVIVSETNRGYAGAINLGARSCTGELLLVANPDIVFQPGCIDRLAGGLEQGAAVAGPKFVWDDRGEWLLPPAEAMRRRDKVSEILAERNRWWAGRRSRSRLAARLRFWRVESAGDVPALSGAVLAINRSWMVRAGGFDERYPLYFEEIDFLRTVRRLGGEVRYVPEARCRHLYGQSTAGRTDAEAKYRISEYLFHRKWHESWLIAAMARWGGVGDGLRESLPAGPADFELPEGDPASFVVEVAPTSSFEMAAGFFPRERRVRIPRDVLESYHGPELYLRVVRLEKLEVVARWRVV